MEASVVVGQIPISWHIEKNVAAIAAVIDECRPNEIVVLPEGAISGYDDDLSMLIDVDVDGIRHAVEWLSEQTRRKAIHLFCGSLLHEHGTWWNAAIHFDPGGRRRTYRKVNLATHERGRLASGERASDNSDAPGQRHSHRRRPDLSRPALPRAVAVSEPTPALRRSSTSPMLPIPRSCRGSGAAIWLAAQRRISVSSSPQTSLTCASIALL